MLNPNKEDKNFTPNQVAALVESLRNDIKAIAEDTTSIREDMTEVKDRLSILETDVRTVKDAIQIALPSLNQRVSKLEAKIGV